MTNQSTIDKLIEMRLTAMADAFRIQQDDPKFKEIPFEDQFDQPDASIMDINYTSGRKLNKEFTERLATCYYIVDHRNIFITSSTGCGKNLHGLRLWHGGM